MHEEQGPIKDTYDAYMDLSTFMVYDNNITDKLSFLEVNLRKCKGFIEEYHEAKEKQLIAKFSSYKTMRYAASAFNQFFNNQGV